MQVSSTRARSHHQLGYRTAWLIEHHFSDYYPCPAPTVYMAHIAARFPDLAVGTCVLVTPWYEPLRLAGELAMLSNMTERLYVGLGRGTAKYEYDAFDVDMTEARGASPRCGTSSIAPWTGSRSPTTAPMSASRRRFGSARRRFASVWSSSARSARPLRGRDGQARPHHVHDVRLADLSSCPRGRLVRTRLARSPQPRPYAPSS